MRLPKRGEKGFTLIELLIVVAILGVLAAVVIPNVGKFIGKGKTEAAETELANIQSATVSMMVDNGIQTLLNPVLAGSATNDMSKFPSPSTNSTTNYVLFGFKGVANSNYVQTQNTTKTYYTDTQGTVYQVP